MKLTQILIHSVLVVTGTQVGTQVFCFLCYKTLSLSIMLLDLHSDGCSVTAASLQLWDSTLKLAVDCEGDEEVVKLEEKAGSMCRRRLIQ